MKPLSPIDKQLRIATGYCLVATLLFMLLGLVVGGELQGVLVWLVLAGPNMLLFFLCYMKRASQHKYWMAQVCYGLLWYLLLVGVSCASTKSIEGIFYGSFLFVFGFFTFGLPCLFFTIGGSLILERQLLGMTKK